MAEFRSTIKESVDDNKDKEVNYRNLHTNCIIDDLKTERTILVPYLSLTNKYRHFLQPLIINTEELDDITLAYFRFSPKRLSQFLYGTPDFWYALMEINHCKSIMEFDKSSYNVYDPEELHDLINEILIKEGILV